MFGREFMIRTDNRPLKETPGSQRGAPFNRKAVLEAVYEAYSTRLRFGKPSFVAWGSRGDLTSFYTTNDYIVVNPCYL